VQRAEGAYLQLESGAWILDAISSWWVNTHGHAHPHIAEAISQQARQLEQVIFAGFTHESAVRLAERLKQRLPEHFGRFFYSDDGSTAVEVALKLALQYFYNRGEPRKKLLAFEHSYHGDTFGAMSLSGEAVFHKPFQDHMFEVQLVPLPEDEQANNSLEVIERHLADAPAAAMIVEPLVLGAGGMKMYSPSAWNKIVSYLHERGVFVIADEVMTGFGRTGTLFATDQCTQKPDLMCFSKGITGGFLPLGLTAVADTIVEAFDTQDRDKFFLHGHSFTANPLACAAANASLDLFEQEETWFNIRRIELRHDDFRNTFQPPAAIHSVRQTGTILALELAADDAGYLSQRGPELYDAFMQENILLRPLGNTLYFMPPYVVTDHELDWVYNTIERVLNRMFANAS
jgi:adenosylmethionine-8-amino-7-oxononanoate aminotransferase